MTLTVPNLYYRAVIKWVQHVFLFYTEKTYKNYPYLYQITVSDAAGNTENSPWISCRWE